MAAIDWTENFNKYKGLWVAMKDDQKTVVASAETLRETREKAKEKGYSDPIFFRVPTEIIPYIGGFYEVQIS